MHTTHLRTALALAAVALVTVACGDDDDDAATQPAATDAAPTTTVAVATTDGDVAALCEANLALNVAADNDAWYSTEGDVTAAKAYYQEHLAVPLDVMEDSAPAEVAPPLATYLHAWREVGASGDVSGLGEDGVLAAHREVRLFLHEHCGWATIDVTVTDGAIDGAPATIAAGPMSLRMTSKAGAHRVEVFTKAVDRPLAELLALPDAERQAALVPTFIGLSADTGHTAVSVATELPAGDYVILCLEDGHAAAGEAVQFSVT